MTIEPLKPFSVRVTIMGHTKSDVMERITDLGGDLIDNYIEDSIEEIIDDCELCHTPKGCNYCVMTHGGMER